MTLSSLNLTIGRLAITGFSRAEARRIEDAFRAELGRVAVGDVMPLPAPPEHIVTHLPESHTATPERVGIDAARALIRGLGP